MTEGLVVRGLGFAYDGEAVLHDIDLEVADGEIVCLLGPSGCGKTTCLRIVAGLERPDSGEVLIDGRPVAGPRLHVPPEARRVGLVLQDFALFPHLDILGNVLFGIHGGDKAAREIEALGLLEQVGLAALARSWPHLISGGEQQRVALARALAPRPDVMLMDEPFSGLDVSLRAEVREAAIAMLRERRAPTLVVTHDPFEALEIADRIILMRDGGIVQSGTAEEIYLDPVDAWSMRFFGEPNRLRATISKGGVATPFGAIPCPSLPEDTAVDIMFRSSSLSVDDSGQGTRFMVLSSRLLGPVRRVVVRDEDDSLRFTLDLPRRDQVITGEPIFLSARLEEFRIFVS